MSWHPTLDDIERRTDGPRDQPRLRGGSKIPNLPLLGEQGGCWCGEPHNHDWDGKADGAPHPREAAAAAARLEMRAAP